MATSEAIREEIRERDYSNGDLLRGWSTHCSATAKSIDQATKPTELLNGLRSANLRLGEARRRQHLLGNGNYALPDDKQMDLYAFQHFELVWGTIKYSSMIKALEYRKAGDRSVKANIVESERVPGEEILVISIDDTESQGKGAPYRTESAITNLESILPIDQIRALVGQPDDLPRKSGPKHIQRGQILHRT
ncbi:MAG TPA: hypothetical protein VG917_05445 [Patescibacteria group bacterium]|nr:hypothetical protein [Patescibacteria group bacterium]